MSLKLKASPAESVIRSVGDPPNGVLVFANPDGGPTWAVDSAWMPEKMEGSGIGVEFHESEDGIWESQTPVDLEAVLDGAADDETRAVIFMYAVSIPQAAAEAHAPKLRWERLDREVAFARRCTDLMLERGWFKAVEE